MAPKTPKRVPVVLLSGGNPRIAKADGGAPVQAYIAAMAGWKRDVGKRLDALIVRTVPGVRKAVAGASLRPLPPGPSKHKDVRYADIHEGEFDETEMAAWVKQAAALPGWDPSQPSTPEQTHSSKAKPKARQDWREETLARMRKLILQADPDMVEERKWKKPSNAMTGVPVWSHDGIVCTGETYKNVVKLTFARGAGLPDPSRLFNASLEGNARRAIDIHEGEKVDAHAFKALVKAAVVRNSAAKKR